MAIEDETEYMDPSVPTDLLQLHLDLEQEGITPDEFRQAVEDD